MYRVQQSAVSVIEGCERIGATIHRQKMGTRRVYLELAKENAFISNASLWERVTRVTEKNSPAIENTLGIVKVRVELVWRNAVCCGRGGDQTEIII